MDDRSRIRYITGLRGYAALLVFLIHTGGFFGGSTPVLKNIIGFGGSGVIIFFVISAFTLCLSITRHPTFQYKKYLYRRFLRIAPMYYLIILLVYMTGDSIGGASYYKELFHIQSYDLANLLYHLSFLSLFNEKYQAAIIGVEWTIPLEFFYYLIIPIMFFLTRKNLIFLGGLLILGVYCFFHRDFYFHSLYVTRFGGGEWAIEPNLAVYCIGIITFFAVQSRHIPITFSNIKKSIPAFLTLMIFLCYLVYNSTGNEGWYVAALLAIVVYLVQIKPFLLQRISNRGMYTFLENLPLICLLLLFYVFTLFPMQAFQIVIALFSGVLIITLNEGGGLKRVLFENKFIVHLGMVSYSFYLLHIIIINLIERLHLHSGVLQFIVTLALTLVASTITYQYIEKPFLSGKVRLFSFTRVIRTRRKLRFTK